MYSIFLLILLDYNGIQSHEQRDEYCLYCCAIHGMFSRALWIVPRVYTASESYQGKGSCQDYGVQYIPVAYYSMIFMHVCGVVECIARVTPSAAL